MEYNFLSGSTVNYDINLFFDIMSSENCYLGFAKNEHTWGINTLIKINFSPFINFSSEVIAKDGNIITDKYFDNNSSKVFSDTIEEGYKRIFIAKLPKVFINTSEENNVNNYIFIPENEIGQLYSVFINNEWIEINGLNPLYKFKDLDTYQYYVFNYNKSLYTKAKIEETKNKNYNAISIPVKIGYSLNNEYVPSEILNGIGNLNRTISNNGEIVITGMDPIYSLSADKKLGNFFILDSNNNIIQDRMKFVESFDDSIYRIMVFEYPTINGNTIRIKITSGDGVYQRLSIYQESLPFYSAHPIADNNPPSLSISYLTEPNVSKSIFEVLGISRILSSEIYFCRQLRSTDNVDMLEQIGFIIEDFIIDADQSIFVKYIKTQNRELAVKYECDSVMLDKSLPSTLPTEEIYRKLFISYRPKLSDGSTASANNYTGSEIFNNDSYEQNIGTLIYIANKVPVYRKYISSSEEFKIII